MKAEAILKLNPNAKTVVSNNDGTFKVLDVNDAEISVDMTLVDAKANELQTEFDAKVQAEKDAKASGNQKLLDLGLTQAEATALTGYTPPVAE